MCFRLRVQLRQVANAANAKCCQAQSEEVYLKGIRHDVTLEASYTFS